VPNLTVLENVQLAKEICSDSLDSKDMQTKVGLGDRLDNFPSQISGGEQQGFHSKGFGQVYILLKHILIISQYLSYDDPQK
jgi:ABC-type nitrate/sulfonate/bicarbonate transport system ATPase subunit